jgi:hypothetical protein
MTVISTVVDVTNGLTYSGNAVVDTGVLVVFSGGTSIDTDAANGGLVVVAAGGSAEKTTLGDGVSRTFLDRRSSRLLVQEAKS